MATITLENVRVVRGGTLALAVDALEIADGELLAVVGPSGSGKSTLLRAIAGLDPLASGHVLFDGYDVTRLETAKRSVAMVFQDNVLLPFKDVRGNVAFPLEVRHTPRDEISQRVEAEARALEIEHLLERMPKQLGAGHQQLVQAARAMVRVPAVFLMDEPLARLDARLRLQMRQEFRLLQQGYGVTTAFVTNDQEEAMVMADRIAVLEEGWVRQVGLPLELYHHPASRFVAEFIGSPPMGFVAGRIEVDKPGYWVSFGDFRLRAWLPALGEVSSARVDVGLRAEDVVVDERGVAVPVKRSYHLGSHGFTQVELAPGETVEMRTADFGPSAGSTVKVGLRRLHLFSQETGSALGLIETA
ncbi:MAG: ABC transporter ATP-binding protein [Acidimicrobiia bacterium]|nr:ABC transporter ATP-binding protein [Acidimicrobiia bacterium]